MFFRFMLFLSCFIAIPFQAKASMEDFFKYFEVDMQVDLPDPEEYIEKFRDTQSLYDKGYQSRFDMGKQFNPEFSKVIRIYGRSEKRIKNEFEDDLLEIILALPKYTYQYIGPMIHEVPGMSEKITNLPGIKETKNQFPKDIAEKVKGIEDLEFMSPSLYVLLMPETWGEKRLEDLDKPQKKKAKRPKNFEMPKFLRDKVEEPINKDIEKTNIVKKETNNQPEIKVGLNQRTIHPTLTSPLTYRDVEAFIDTLDDVMALGKENIHAFMSGEIVLDMWEEEHNTALSQNGLKDLVNPCQRLVVKSKVSGLYQSLYGVVAKQGFTPEEWAYTCDRVVKAFRAVDANMETAYAIRFYRRGYYDKYIEKLPEKWRDDMYATEAALVKMYAVSQEDMESVRPYHKKLQERFLDSRQKIWTMPIFY